MNNTTSVLTPIETAMTKLAEQKEYKAHLVYEDKQVVFLIEKVIPEQNLACSLTFIFWVEDLEEDGASVHSIDDVLEKKHHSFNFYPRIKLLNNIIRKQQDIDYISEIYHKLLNDQLEFTNIFSPIDE